jgi:hypothetical protein
MGITIAYRGRLADLTRIEDFEDRLLDFALEVGGLAQVWRSQSDEGPPRLVRGIILNLAPGQETASLLVSPEGWLINLTDIEDAECGRLTEAPWCFVKTQFGPLEGHVALVEMFAALRREFLPELEVRDDGGYYPTRDLAELVRRRSLIQQGIDGLVEGLRRHGLSGEAAEDPDILLRHIERIAAQAHRVLQRPAEHPPVAFPEESTGTPGSETTEALWDELFKHNRRQQERLGRAIEERRACGEEDESAFEAALSDLGLDAPDEGLEPDEPWREDEQELFAEPPEDVLESAGPEDDDPFGAEEDRHPLLQSAMGLLKRLHEVFRAAGPQFSPSLHTLFQGAGDAMGGLVQAVPRGEDEDDADTYGLRVTQLKRALRGAAFACGALYSLRSAATAEQFDELHGALRQLEKDIFQEIGRLRAEHRADEA